MTHKTGALRNMIRRKHIAHRLLDEISKKRGVIASIITVMALATVIISMHSQSASAVPGVPNAPTVVFKEDFENGVTNSPSLISNYIGAAPQNETYTATPYYLDPAQCNGFIVSINAPANTAYGGCGGSGVDYLRNIANLVGVYNGQPSINGNHALTGLTGVGGTGAGIMLDTVAPVTLPTSGRFLTATVDAGAVCTSNDGILSFYFVNGATETPLSSAPIRPCSSTSTPGNPPARTSTFGGNTLRVGRYSADTPILFTGSSVGLRLRNAQAAVGGNDNAIDNIQIIDVTPSFDKSFGPNPTSVGSASTLTFTLTNTTDLLAKNDMSFTDNLSSGLIVATPNNITSNCGNGVVTAAPGATSIAITGADLNAGQSSCTVTVRVVAANGGAASFSNGPSNMSNMVGLVPPTSAATMTFGVPAIRTTKTVTPSTGVAVGTQLNYTITSTNIGQVPIANVSVSDPRLASLNCSPALGSALAIGASITCTGSYTATQSDIDAGSISNTANGCGTPTGSPQICDDDTQTVAINRTPQLSLTKNVTGFADNDGSGAVSTGDTVHYKIVATNSGNLTITGATVSDSRISVLSCTPAIPVASLAPGGTITCTGDITATSGDQTAGNVVNTATCTGTPPSGTTLPTCSATSTQAMTAAAPDVQIIKAAPTNNDADHTSSITTGDTLTYTLTLRNSGTQTLTAVTASDPMLSGLTCGPTTSTGSAFANGSGSLPINVSVPCTGQHVVTQAEQNSGSIANTASVTAQSAGGPVTDTDTQTVQTAPAAPSLAVTKTASQTTGLRLGDVVTYTIVTTNNGNVTLSNVTPTDPIVGALSCSPAAPATLNPTQSVQCTGQHTISQADMNAGQVINQARACSGALCANSNQVLIQLTQAAHATATKTTATPRFTDVDGSGAPSAGDVLHYNLKLLNDGNVTLSTVSVADTPALTGFACTPAIPVASLAPGASITCTGDHTITTGEQTAGMANDTMTSTANNPAGSAIAIAPASLSQPVTPPAVALGLSKTVLSSTDPDSSGDLSQGDVVTYKIVATNNGNVALTGTTVSDPSLTGLSCTPAIPTTLAAGASITCTGNYTITLADVNAGNHQNTANASGTAPSGSVVTGTDSQTITLLQEPHLATAKSLLNYADSDNSGNITPGDVLHYQIITSNTGNVTLDNVIASDTLVTTLACTPGTPTASLNPGQSITCTGNYTATQADQDAGQVVNTANASGLDPNAVVADATDTVTQATAGRAPDATIAKTIHNFTSDTRFSQGDSVPYDISYTNTGNVTLNAVAVSDANIANLTCNQSAPVSLAPGATIACSGNGPTLTRSDVLTGFINNTADGTGSSQTVTSLSRQASRTALVLDPKVAITLDKTSSIQDKNGNKAADPGETIIYTIKAINTGNVAVIGANIADNKLPNLSCNSGNPGTLSIGQTVTCTGSYTVTQTDFSNKTVMNTASIAGQDVWGNGTAAQDTVADPTVPVNGRGLTNTGTSLLLATISGLLLIASSIFVFKGLNARSTKQLNT